MASTAIVCVEEPGCLSLHMLRCKATGLLTQGRARLGADRRARCSRANGNVTRQATFRVPVGAVPGSVVPDARERSLHSASLVANGHLAAALAGRRRGIVGARAARRDSADPRRPRHAGSGGHMRRRAFVFSLTNS